MHLFQVFKEFKFSIKLFYNFFFFYVNEKYLKIRRLNVIKIRKKDYKKRLVKNNKDFLNNKQKKKRLGRIQKYTRKLKKKKNAGIIAKIFETNSSFHVK